MNFATRINTEAAHHAPSADAIYTEGPWLGGLPAITVTVTTAQAAAAAKALRTVFAMDYQSEALHSHFEIKRVAVSAYGDGAIRIDTRVGLAGRGDLAGTDRTFYVGPRGGVYTYAGGRGGRLTGRAALVASHNG